MSHKPESETARLEAANWILNAPEELLIPAPQEPELIRAELDADRIDRINPQ